MSADIINLLGRACKPAKLAEFPVTPRTVRHREHAHVYHAILVRDDVSVGELAHALRFSGIVVSTDPASGQTVVHRNPPPKGAA
jgi:hypothetical protein